MSLLTLIPLEAGEHLGDGVWFVEPVLGFLVLLVVLVLVGGALLYLRRTGFSLASWLGRSPSPETEAKQILAERFARGDISSDDFLERASVLNWTPGIGQDTPGIKRR
jgi:putative membrane protein